MLSFTFHGTASPGWGQFQGIGCLYIGLIGPVPSHASPCSNTLSCGYFYILAYGESLTGKSIPSHKYPLKEFCLRTPTWIE